MNFNHPTDSTFHGLGIAPGLLEILGRLHYVNPTPIQHLSIPPAIEGKDIVGIAETGTGKTLAFGIPMIQILARKKGQGLVILPTRELAQQVDSELHKVGRTLGLKTAVLIGGLSMRPQLDAIARNPHIIIATPGRLIDHLNQKTLKVDRVTILVLDEADRMLDMGFEPQIRRILKDVPGDRQTMLFSATIPQEVFKIASASMKLPVRIEVAPSGKTPDLVSQELFVVDKNSKLRLLEKIIGDYKGSILVFTRTKHGARRLTKDIRLMGHGAAEIHSNRSLHQRREALEGFKSGKYRILVATDIAARGIDVKNIELVLNYDLPSHSEDYVHRIGRTGRAGREGHAISFVLPVEQMEVRNIERLMRKSLRISTLPELPAGRAGFVETRPRISHSRLSTPRGGFRKRGGHLFLKKTSSESRFKKAEQ